MENSSFVLVSGAVALICVVFVEFRVYKAYKRSRTDLLGKINDAENELQEDILNLDKDELRKTGAGRELIKLLYVSTDDAFRSQSQNMANPKVHVQSRAYIPNFSSATAVLMIVLLTFGLIMGFSIGDTDYLNPSTSSAQASQIKIENAHQQAIYEMEQSLAQAQTETEIITLRRQQLLLDAHYKELLEFNEALQRRENAFGTLENILKISGIALSIAIVISTILWVSSRVFASLRSRPYKTTSIISNLEWTPFNPWLIAEYRKRKIEEARNKERLARQEALIKGYEKQIQIISDRNSK